MSAVFATLRGYERGWLMPDLLAGVTLAAVAVPGQMAVAHLASMPLVTGLYAMIVAALAVALFARTPQLQVGVDSTTAPIVAVGIAGVAALGSSQYVQLVILTSLLVGLLFLLVGSTGLVAIADFISRPVITGFLGGIAVTIVVSQLPAMLGLPPQTGHVIERLATTLSELGSVNLAALTISVASLAGLVVAARLAPKLPGVLLVVAAAILLVGFLHLGSRGDVAVLGPLPQGLPSLTLPEFTLDSLRLALPTAAAVTLIGLAQTAATSRSAADASDAVVDIKADFRGVGVGSVLASLVGAQNVDASPGGTALVVASRARSQLYSLVAAAIILALVLFGGALTTDLPYATLGAVMVYLSIRIFNFEQMRQMLAFSWTAFSLMLLTLLGVVILGVEVGVLLAVAVAIGHRARHTTRPELLELGESPGGGWAPLIDPAVSARAGVQVFRMNGPLWFADANWFADRVYQAVAAAESTKLVVLDATANDDIDFDGTEVLGELSARLRRRGCDVVFVTTAGMAQSATHRSGLVDAVGPQNFYRSVAEAVAARAPVTSD